MKAAMMLTMETNARAVAVELLARWRHLHEPPLIPEHESAFWSNLSPRDRAFAFDLIHGIIRWRGTLDHIIRVLLRRSEDQMEPLVRAILQLGAYQLLMQGGAADYAVIDTSVNLARRCGAARAAGLVNAVLRHIQRLRVGAQPRQAPRPDAFALDARREMRLSKPIFPDPKTDFSAYLAAAASHPPELVAAMLAWLGPDLILPIMIADNCRPPIALRADRPDFSPPPDAGLRSHEEPGYFLAAAGWTSSVEALVQRGELCPQDSTAGLAVRELIGLLQDRSTERPVAVSAHADRSANLKILDLCAGLGTKTVQLARAFPTADITAADVAPEKLRRLSVCVRRLGLANVSVLPAAIIKSDTENHPDGERDRPFDIILVDAPCSNTGVLARRVQSRWRWPALNRAALFDQQRKLLQWAAGVLADRGWLVYSTCSIDPEENRSGVTAALLQDRKSSWRVLSDKVVLPTDTGDPAQRRDGGFVCILRRAG